MKIIDTTNTTNTTIQFKAAIKYNRKEILNSLGQDKKLEQKDYSTISKLLDNIDTFSKMKEQSIVEITPRVNKGQVNLLAQVYDKTKKVMGIVWERSVRTLIKNPDFQNKYKQSISTLIKNTEKAQKGINKISQTIQKSKHIKGITYNGKQLSLSPENINKFFQNSTFQNYYLASLKKGYNPTKNIVKLISDLDKKNDGKNLYLGIENAGKKHIFSYFTVTSIDKNGSTKKQIMLTELFKIPLSDRLSANA